MDEYEAVFERKNRQERKKERRHKAQKHAQDVIAQLADGDIDTGGESFEMTYHPSKHEALWLRDSLRAFYDRALITDVVASIKGGKEASVYACQAHPATGETLLAAKVYRPRMFRQLRNDIAYREGRDILTSAGRVVKKTDHRVMRALNKKTDFGAQVAHTSWLMHEFTTLERLHQAGAAVPKPYSAGENAILMQYIGDENGAAPRLIDVELDAQEARDLFEEVMRNIELLLAHGFAHGDLSAYNILYHDGAITLIDFPQVVDTHSNRRAFAIFEREVQRICEYFASYGIRVPAREIAARMWQQHMAKRPLDEAADLSRLFDSEGE